MSETRIYALLAELQGEIAATLHPQTITTVKAGDNLQAALDLGGAIQLDTGIWSGTYIVRSGTVLTGQGVGSVIQGLTGPALVVEPGSRAIQIADLTAQSQASEVITIGENSARQTQLAQVPDDIRLTRVMIPSHRGKRGLAIHGSNVTLTDCEVIDVYDPNGQDSQAVYVGNTPGNVTVFGGRYSAGSEVFLSGGDVTRIPQLTPDSILLDHVTLFRPLSWQTDGIKRKVKNLLEVKNGRHVTLQSCTLDGCWADGQAGEAIVLTPALDGAIQTPPVQSGDVQDVLVNDCDIRNCGSGFNLLGRHYTSVTPNAMSHVAVTNSRFTISRAQFGGRGQLAIIQAEPGIISFDTCDVQADGSSLLYYAFGSVLDPITRTSRQGGKLGSLSLTNSRCTIGPYGINLGGYANAVNWQAAVGQLTVTANTFTGGSAMQKALPGNTYV